MDKLEGSSDTGLRIPNLQIFRQLPPMYWKTDAVGSDKPTKEFLHRPNSRPESSCTATATEQLDVARILPDQFSHRRVRGPEQVCQKPDPAIPLCHFCIFPTRGAIIDNTLPFRAKPFGSQVSGNYQLICNRFFNRSSMFRLSAKCNKSRRRS